jgi:hypothetical protein
VPGELPLGTGCAESEQPCAERIALSAEARIPVVKASTREIKLTSIFLLSMQRLNVAKSLMGNMGKIGFFLVRA